MTEKPTLPSDSAEDGVREWTGLMACPRLAGRLADGSNFLPPLVGSGLLLAFLPNRRTLTEKEREGKEEREIQHISVAMG